MLGISTKDIAFLEQIIRVCQSRGSFKAEEMVEVGTIYKKLLEIVNNVKELAEEEKKRTETIPEETPLDLEN